MSNVFNGVSARTHRFWIAFCHGVEENGSRTCANKRSKILLILEVEYGKIKITNKRLRTKREKIYGTIIVVYK